MRIVLAYVVVALVVGIITNGKEFWENLRAYLFVPMFHHDDQLKDVYIGLFAILFFGALWPLFIIELIWPKRK